LSARPKYRSPLEKKIQTDIEIDMGAEPDLLFLRNNVGRAVYTTDAGKPYFVHYGLGVGSPDLVSILRAPDGLGVWFCLEVKRPGEEPDDEQKKVHEIWRSFGALVYVVHSVAEARTALEIARSRVTRSTKL